MGLRRRRCSCWLWWLVLIIIIIVVVVKVIVISSTKILLNVMDRLVLRVLCPGLLNRHNLSVSLIYPKGN